MCVDHVGAGEFTIHFSPGDRGLHLPSLAKKVNAPLMPEGGEAGVSNDWCITFESLPCRKERTKRGRGRVF